MTNFYRPQLVALVTALLMLGGAFGSCQRASYSFQPPAPAPVAAVVPPAACLTAAPGPAALAAPPAPAAVEEHHRRTVRPLVVRKPLAVLPARRRGRAGQPMVTHARPAVASRLVAVLPRPVGADTPAPTQPNKWVAVGLAVLLGFLGAHLFYLGRRRRAWGYLGATLLCAGLIAVLLATLPVATLKAGLVVLFLICLAVVGIGTVYAYALLDALSMLLYGPEAVG